MQSVKFIVVKIKSLIIPCLILLFTICLIIFSNTNLEASKHGIALWANAVLPSLFPFFIATELLSRTNIVSYLGKLFHGIMKPVFNVSGEGIFALIMGVISGYPIGAKIVVNLKKQGFLNDVESERLIAFTNNSGPLFILGTVGISLFVSKRIGYILFFSHIISSLLVGFIFRWWKKNDEKNSLKETPSFNDNNHISFSNLGEVIGESIASSIHTILIVGGFVVLFSVVCSILENSNVINFLTYMFAPILNKFNISSNLIHSLIIGMIEVTNGVKYVSVLGLSNINILVTSFLLGFGGLSILLQVLSIISKAKISIKPYIIGKFLQGIFSVIITSLIIY